MRTEAGTKAALGGLYPSSSLYMGCEYVKPHAGHGAEAGERVWSRPSKWITTHTPAEIAAKMPADYAGGDPELYVKAVGDSIGMFNADGMMPAEGAQNVLNVLVAVLPERQARRRTRSTCRKTYTTEFASKAPKS